MKNTFVCDYCKQEKQLSQAIFSDDGVHCIDCDNELKNKLQKGNM